MTRQVRETVGVVGLGSMGLPMAQTLVGKGFRAIGYDVSEARGSAAMATGIEILPEVGEIFTKANFVLFSLPSAREVEAVVKAPGGLLERSRASRVIVIDTSTSEPDVSRRLATELASVGHGFLDAPVSGGPAGAGSGNLTMMIGGSEEDVALARPAIEAIASKILHVGPAGAGNVAKLVNNMLVAAHMLTTSEGLRLAAAAGVDPDAALRVVNAATGRSALSEIHFPKWIMSDRFDSGFSVGLMRKDVRLAQELAERVGVELPIAEAVSQQWNSGPRQLSDTDDFTRMGAVTSDRDPSSKKVA
ncbi:NAD(P)-dependent oxidoreductase [Microvirga massiliensis]|uniref:NAD(P)-dependent oxidoreductase n=1 Tax=Microvirga massiliensis TaxID=1033741 RepID=UPI00062B5BC8|nr:NAD(P)-dependent oxidoreductase [Microvirga massiliensis]